MSKSNKTSSSKSQTGGKRKISDYQRFMSKELMRQRKSHPNLANTEYMSRAAKEWSRYKKAHGIVTGVKVAAKRSTSKTTRTKKKSPAKRKPAVKRKTTTVKRKATGSKSAKRSTRSKSKSKKK